MLLPTPIGPLWLEVSARGVRRLEPALFPRGKEAAGPLVEQVAEALDRYFRGERPSFLDIPLDYSGLGLWRVGVYEATRRVPYGRSTSYSAVGEAAGLPARAVGMALRTCPFFLLVPAHRVIYADGRLGGFAGREGLKLWLLRFEGAL
ncbi:methylated-DNA--[protein]-cysteine S-methyltransferase [Thermus sediminis]|uniref:methylated-DNA--[protein]-cysteine S-methyltransferase n=1 Tax=Thermus sediminis TaxID=1761908 RepID=UPI000E3BD56C|nr:methylated-DNA--[protein]-cysteine S-methyltransferase [Thermus sediminis]